MKYQLPLPVRARRFCSRSSMLMLVAQRAPMTAPLIMQEVRLLGTSGFTEVLKWTVTAVAGLGAFDSVSGATAIKQVLPTPESNTVNATAGNVLTFSFQMSGSTHTAGSWQVTGTLPTGLTHANAKNSNFDSISGVPRQNGSFPITVKAWENSNYSGRSASKSFTINITGGVTPVITVQPQSTAIASGTTTTLSVTATGTSNLYQWYRGISGITTNLISGATSATYTTPALTLTTTYWVRITGTGGVTSSDSAVVTVSAPPVIVAPPASTTINAGSTATLVVQASGTANQYQWYAGDTGDESLPVSGANGFSFTTPALNSSTSYWVKVSNAAGTVNSAAALVTVNAPPAITAQPGDAMIAPGGTATLVVQASGTGNSFQWYRGPAGDETNPASGATSASFTTPALTETTSYWAKVTNTAGSVNSTAAAVTVVAPPQIATQPTGSVIAPGTSTSLSVTANGTGLSYQWYTGTPGDTASPAPDGTGATLTTPTLNATTTYWVRVSNTGGHVDSASVTVTVAEPIVITAQPQSTTVPSGASVTLSVAASGSPVAYQWYAGTSGDEAQPVTDAVSASFTTPPLSVNASYWVKLTNAAGPVHSTAAAITIRDTFTSWAAGRFAPAELADSAISGPTADPDGDGISNEAERILGTSPVTAGSTAPVTIVVNAGQVQLSFSAAPATGPGYAGLVRHYTLESSGNLQSGPWAAVPGYEDVTATGQSVAATGGPTLGKAFYRLRAWLAGS